jgi:hypothetical protein
MGSITHIDYPEDPAGSNPATQPTPNGSNKLATPDLTHGKEAKGGEGRGGFPQTKNAMWGLTSAPWKWRSWWIATSRRDEVIRAASRHMIRKNQPHATQPGGPALRISPKAETGPDRTAEACQTEACRIAGPDMQMNTDGIEPTSYILAVIMGVGYEAARSSAGPSIKYLACPTQSICLGMILNI